MSIYKKVFTDSLKNVWYNPKYWLFGLFAIFFGGSIELELFDNFFNQSKNVYVDLTSSSFGGFFNPAVLSKIPAAAMNDFGMFAKMSFLFIAFCIFLAIIVVLEILAQLVIINKVYQSRKNKQLVDGLSETYTQLIKANVDKLWPVISINIVYKAFVFLLFIVVGLPVILTANNPVFWSDVIYILLFVLILPVAIVGAMILRYATVYIKVKSMTIKTAIVAAWDLFKKNWLLTIEMSLLLFFLTILASLAVVMLILALSIPYYFLSLVIGLILPQQFALLLVGLFIVIAFVVFMIGASMISTFNIAVWTNLFSEIENKPKDGKIAQIVNKFRNR